MKTHSCTWLMALAAAGMIHAQTPTSKSAAVDTPKIDFATIDKDANGKLTKEEALIVVELDAGFDKLDTDRDGSITPAEFSHWNRAGKTVAVPHDPSIAPSGSAGAQHMPNPN